MNTFAILALAAATVGSGFGYSKPNVGGKRLLRSHVVADGPAPPGGMIQPPPGGGGPGGGQAGRRFPNTRSQVFFLDPSKMNIGWQSGGSGSERVFLTHDQPVPFRYNFNQGFIYRLKLSNIPNHPDQALYPTIEVAPSTPATDAYLTHNPIPLQFTPEDFEQVIDGGNFVTKVIYLPDPKYQELAIAGVETLVSTRLEPGVDPILEADKRGTILMIVRLGQIDLEMGNGNVGVSSVPAPANGGMISIPGTTTVLPPGALPPGVLESAPAQAPLIQPLPAEAPTIPSGEAPPPAAVPPPADAPPTAPPLPNPELPIAVPGPNGGN